MVPSRPSLMAALLALALAGHGAAALAADGHDHGEAPATAAAPASPRFAVQTDLFELVGVLEGGQLTLYLDHADDNRPVENATLELEVGGSAVPVTAHGPGEFEAELAQAPGEGELAIAAVVTAGDAADLLAADLDIHGDDHAEAGEEGEGAHADGGGVDLVRWGGWLVAAFAVLALLFTRSRRAALGTLAASAATSRQGGAA